MDARREWSSLLPASRIYNPGLLVLSDYSPGDHTGPAICLRFVVDRAVELRDVPAACPPVIYMPSVEREHPRAGEACP